MENRARLVLKYTQEMDMLFSRMIESFSCKDVGCDSCPFSIKNSVKGMYCSHYGNAKGKEFFEAKDREDLTREMKLLQEAFREVHFKDQNKCMDCIEVANCYPPNVVTHPVEYSACENFEGEKEDEFLITEKGFKRDIQRMALYLEDFYSGSDTVVLGKNFTKGVITLYSLNNGTIEVLDMESIPDMRILAKIGMSDLNTEIEKIASDVNGPLGRFEDCFNWRKMINSSPLITALRNGSDIKFEALPFEELPF